MNEYLEEDIKRCIFNGMRSNGLQNLAFKFKHPLPQKNYCHILRDFVDDVYIYIYIYVCVCVCMWRRAKAVADPGILFEGEGVQQIQMMTEGR
jgi:hypothetical protein